MKIKLARIGCAAVALTLVFSSLCACSGGDEQENTTLPPIDASEVDWVLEPSVNATDIMPVFSNEGGYNMKLPASVITVKNPTSTYVENSCGLIGYGGEYLLNAKYENINYCSECKCILAYTDITEGYADRIDTVTYKSLGEHGGHGLAGMSSYWYNGEVVNYYYEMSAPEPADPNETCVVQQCIVNADGGFEGSGLYGIARGKQIIVPLEYEKGRRYSEGFCALRKGGKWGYFDAQGRQILPFEFDGYLSDPWMAGAVDIPKESLQPFDFSDGYVAVCKDGAWGIYNEKGEEVVPCRFEAVRPVYNNMSWVKLNGRWGVISVGAQAATAS